MQNHNDDSKRKAPYATVKPFAEVLHKLRQYQLSKVDKLTLTKWGYSPYDASSILSALRFLNIIDASGSTTSNHASIKPDSKYPVELKRIVEEAYSRLFTLCGESLFVMSAKAIEDSLILADAYPDTAKESAKKATSLFVWLCGQAGIELAGVNSPPAVSQTPRTNAALHAFTQTAAKSMKAAAPTHSEVQLDTPLNVIVTIDPSMDEETIYELLSRIQRASRRITNAG